MAKLQFVAKAEGENAFNGLKEVDIPSESGGLGFTVVHASWKGSSSFNWATDRIASSGISNVTRVKKGVYQSNLQQQLCIIQLYRYDWCWIRRL